MRRFIKGFLLSTSIGLLIFCTTIVLFFDASWLQTTTIFQFYLANFLVSLVYFFARRLEFRSVILELFVEFFVMEGTILSLGVLLKWYAQLKVWQVAIIIAVIFVILKVVEGVSVRQSSNYLNNKLRKKREVLPSGGNV